MYRIEITTENEKNILKIIELENWTKTFKKLKEINTLQLDNVNIKLYKYKTIDDFNNDIVKYCGDFTSYTMTPRKKQKKKKSKSNYIIILELLLFPLIVINEIIKNL